MHAAMNPAQYALNGVSNGSTTNPTLPPTTSTTSLEDAKNMALLFFMDHLMTKNCKRTIHDLSCQFGARGFTAEMREVVGGTQEGLASFLAQYPSLFKVDGDEISITGHGDIGGKGSAQLASESPRNRDYEKEAVEFFEMKLRKFGPEMQIKSLLGHRSQAAPEIRLLSGRHLKDFAEFLMSHTKNFVVDGDRVRLLNMPQPTNQAMDVDEAGKPLAGAKAKQASVEFLKEMLVGLEDNPMPLDILYQRFCDRFPHTVRQDVATNPKELLQFLKLNRAIFFIRSNKVSLVMNRGEIDTEPEMQGLATDRDSVSSGSANESSMAVQPTIILVKSLKQAQLALQELLQENLQIDADLVISFDCKFVSLGVETPEFVSLVVLGAPTHKLFVFDVAHSDIVLLESGIRELLESNEIIKVMHDCRTAVNTLNQRYGIRLNRVFDTQVAHTVAHHKKHNRPIHEIRPINIATAQRLYYPDSLINSNNNPNNKRNDFNWATRPLSDEMLQAVCEDARLLVPQLYLALKGTLPTDCVSLFKQQCQLRLNKVESTSLPLNPSMNGTNNNNQQSTMLDRQRRLQRNLPDTSLPPPPIPNVNQQQKTVQNGCCNCTCHNSTKKTTTTVSVETQTLSTGDVTMTGMFYDN